MRHCRILRSTTFRSNTFRVIETHISWVILTGNFAYKIKKPVNLGFVDFSTLEKRLYFCEEELRLNRRFATDLYLQVIPITGTPTCPELGGDGNIIEYAVKMCEFPQHDLLSTYTTEQRLTLSHVNSIADATARIHRTAQPAMQNTNFGTPDTIYRWSRENFEQIETAIPKNILPAYFQQLKDRTLTQNKPADSVITQRKINGFVRECHGDLHLGNMALIGGHVVPFDCIEFNQELRWIDTISEVAFVAMDLQARGYLEYSWRFINRYLQIIGDYEGIALLRYYIVYRALVRAKVEALQVKQNKISDGSEHQRYRESRRYLDLAHAWSTKNRSAVLLMHGLSGSGKSTAALHLVEILAAIQIRSDVERKRLSGLVPTDACRSAIGKGIYSTNITEQTYHRLAELAKTIIEAGYIVIIDASFLKAAQRNQFRKLASTCGVPCLIIHCDAPVTELRKRIKQRSDANLTRPTLRSRY